MRDTDPSWRHYERAVAAFLDSLGTGAKVTHDKDVPDRHTGKTRQRDVWVEQVFAGHFPVKFLVSCKYWSDALSEQDLDHFNGEFLSSGAHVGIIYAKAGFTRPALEKAKVLGFHCCRLYENQPADMPASLLIPNYFLALPRYRVFIKGIAEHADVKTIGDVLEITDGSESVHDVLSAQALTKEQEEGALANWELARQGYVVAVSVEGDGGSEIEVALHCRYRIFRARLEFTLLNGSYNLTNESFVGGQYSPSIDTMSSDPGPGWEQIEELPATMPQGTAFMRAIGRMDSVFDVLGSQTVER